jgi:hypothetical protein
LNEKVAAGEGSGPQGVLLFEVEFIEYQRKEQSVRASLEATE